MLPPRTLSAAHLPSSRRLASPTASPVPAPLMICSSRPAGSTELLRFTAAACFNLSVSSKQIHKAPVLQNKPGIDRVQALADISRSPLCCRSNETRSPIANPPDSAQLGGTPYHCAKLHPGPCSSVGMRRGTDRHTDGRDQYTFASATPQS